MISLDVTSAKFALAFPVGKLPQVDPNDPVIQVRLSGVPIVARITPKAASPSRPPLPLSLGCVGVIRGPRQVGPGFGGCWSRGGYRAAREVRVRVLPAPWLSFQPTDEPTGWKPVVVQ
jgi:hypothetical protein